MVYLREAATRVVSQECSGARPAFDEVWISVHVYVDEEVDAALCQAEAVLRSALQCGDISAFFYVHYGHGGPHLRIRCRGAPPRVRQTEAQLLELGRAGPLEPPCDGRGAIGAIVASYVPELARYGGAECLRFCEAHFMTSSVVALELARNCTRRSSAEVAPLLLERALYCMVMATRLAFTSVPDAVVFLHGYHLAWLAPRFDHDSEPPSRADRERIRKAMADQFQARSNPRLRAAVQSCWRNPAAFAQKLDEPMALWCHLTGRLFAAMQQRFVLSDTSNGTGVLGSLIHMNNNRLRVGNLDESYLAFAAAKLLDEVTE